MKKMLKVEIHDRGFSTPYLIEEKYIDIVDSLLTQLDELSKEVEQ